MVCPQHTGDFFSPSIFGFVQSDPETLENGSIRHFRFPVYLRVTNGGKAMSDVHVGIEIFKGLVVELLAIVGYDNMEKSEPVD